MPEATGYHLLENIIFVCSDGLSLFSGSITSLHFQGDQKVTDT